MQKKIIALAVAAAFSAPAFAEVTMYGIVDAAVVNVSASGLKGDLIALSGGASGSRIGVKATEDLGNGLTTVAVVEYALDTQVSQGSTAGAVANGSGIGVARQQMLAVAGNFGTVATGYLQTTGYDFAGKFDPLSGSAVSPLQSVTKNDFLIGATTGAARAQRAIAYISPDFSGLTVAVNYSTALAGYGDATVAAANTGGLKTSAFLVSGTYTLDALSVGAVYASTSNDSVPLVATKSEFAVGGSFNLGVATVMGTFQSLSTSNAGAGALTTNGKAVSLSGVVPVSTGAIAVSYAKNTMTNNAANVATIGQNHNGSGFTLGYLHTLSKTTTAYAAYSSVSNGASTNVYSVGNNLLTGMGTAGGSSSLLAVGLRKKF